MLSQEAIIGTNISPLGTQMNCNSWGTFESVGSSETAALCHGGTVDENLWSACPSKELCRNERQQRMLRDARDRARTHLPISGQQQQRSVVTHVGGQGQRPMGIPGAPTTLPQRPMGGPATIVKPENGNPFLDTPRVLTPTRSGQHSPTFLPKKKEGWLKRLGKNMAQGLLNAFGWHLHDFTQNVDLFPHDDED